MAATDGRRAVDLIEGRPLRVGRDSTCEISFPEEARLSRRAVQLVWQGYGVVIANLSRTHGLVVTARDSTIRLPKRDGAGSSTGFFVAAGSALVTGPRWPGSSFGLSVEVGAAGAADTEPADEGLAETQGAVRLNPYTKEFLTALLLCRPRLEDPAGVAPPPSVPELTQQILETTNSWHLLRRLDVDETHRARLTGRVHEHLKGLRHKIRRYELADEGSRITAAVLVDLLVATETLTSEDLARLHDQPWLACQEALWWGD